MHLGVAGPEMAMEGTQCFQSANRQNLHVEICK